MFALALDRDVGIDLESNSRIDDEQEMDDLATRILSPREHTIWSQLSNASARRDAFFRAWTRKEARG